MPDNTLVVAEDSLGINYALFPDIENNKRILVIGPFRFENTYLNQDKLRKDSFNEKQISLIKNYYNSIPEISNMMINISVISIISTLFPKEKFEVKYVKEYKNFDVITNSFHVEEVGEDFDETMNMLAYRYEIENQCLEAITLGNAFKAKQALKGMEGTGVVTRFLPSQRKQKNGLIILNTLFRKLLKRLMYILTILMKSALDLRIR